MTTSRRLTAVLAVLALAGTACLRTEVARVEQLEAVEEPPPLPPEAIPVDPPRGGQGGDPGPDGGTGEAQEVTLRDDVEDPRPVQWESAAYRRDANEVTLRWWSGVEPCTVTADVVVDYLDDAVVITVLEGAPPEAATMSCIAMAVEKTYTVALSEDLGERQIRDGAR